MEGDLQGYTILIQIQNLIWYWLLLKAYTVLIWSVASGVKGH